MVKEKKEEEFELEEEPEKPERFAMSKMMRDYAGTYYSRMPLSAKLTFFVFIVLFVLILLTLIRWVVG